jgi:Tol biopolymer transport system component
MSLNKLILFFATVSVLLSNIPAHAAFPGQNGKIVFQSDRSGSWQLYTIDADGSNLTQITQMPPSDFDQLAPSFSPDGKQIAFCYGTVNSGGTSASEIYVINADGTGLKQLTHDGLNACWPRWSPDGQYLTFFETFTPTGQANIFVMRSDGTGPRTTVTAGEWNFWNSFGGTFSPDGREIVFQSQFGGFVSTVWIMNSNGTRKRRLTPAPLEGLPLDISPDGTHILLLNHGATLLPSSAFVMDLDGKHIQRLTHLDNVHETPMSYSPDGQKILLISDRLNSPFTFDLFTMNSDGSDVRRIASSVATCPADSNCPNGAWGPKPK